MKILDLFSGLGGGLREAAMLRRGHEYITVDFDIKFNSHIIADVMSLSAQDFEKYGRFDFIWASPPCEAFSVASIGHHWGGGKGAYIPKTKHAVHSQNLIAHTINLIEKLNPVSGFLIENPRGVLRKLDVMAGMPRSTVTYCQYGDNRMKPTDLFGRLRFNWEPRPMCKNGDNCHEAAPRGSKTGTQGIKGAAERAVVPLSLWLEILDCIGGNHD